MYESKLRTYTARNVYEGTLAMPNDLTIAAGDFVRQPFIHFDSLFYDRINFNSNFVLRRIGVFSNFADGLVFKDPAQGLNLLVTAYPYKAAAATGTITTTLGTKSVTGTVFNALSAGDFISLQLSGEILQVDAVTTPPTDMDLLDYPMVAGADNWVRLETAGSPISRGIINIRELNQFVDCEVFFNPANFTLPGMSAVIPVVDINNAATGIPDDVTFATKIIDSSFTGDPIHFDVKAVFELME